MAVAAPLVEADKETDEQNYLLWRLQKGVAEGSTEIPKGRFYCLLDVMLSIFAVFF
jgi:hypothetical protein